MVKTTFRSGSSALKALEQTYLLSDSLQYREEAEEETGEYLLNLDDSQGLEQCKGYLCSLERLMVSLGLVLTPKTYRNGFSNSYKVLYR